MASRAGYLVGFLMLCAAHESASAQSISLEQLCGKYPDFAFTEHERELFEGEAAGKADVLKRFFGSGELAGKLRIERDKYHQNDPRGRAPQIDAILLYTICTLLERDPSIPTREKIKIFLGVRTVLSSPISGPQRPTYIPPDSAVPTSASAAAPRAAPAPPQVAPATTPAPAAATPVVASPVPAPPDSERLNADGIWIVTTQPRNCDNQGRSFPVSVSNGIVSSRVARQMQGSLSKDGAIQFNYAVRDNKGYVWTNFLEGKISGQSGSGDMHSLGRGTDCSGTFQIARPH